jgi:hypothetical protein
MIPKSGVRFSDKIMRRKEGGEVPKGACQPFPRHTNKRHRSLMLRARQRAMSGRARLPALRRGSRQGERIRHWLSSSSRVS